MYSATLNIGAVPHGRRLGSGEEEDERAQLENWFSTLESVAAARRPMGPPMPH